MADLGQPVDPHLLLPVDLSGRRAVVTGGCSGIGRSTAEAFLKAGARVALIDINSGAGAALSEQFGRFGTDRVMFIQCDVRDPHQVESAAGAVVARFGGIHILVNSAGISAGLGAPMECLPIELWQRMMDVNLNGTFYWCQVAGREMIRGGEGVIVNVASISGSRLNRGLNFLGPYNVSKAGVIMLTKVLAEAWAPYGIRVNSVSPGYTRTPLIEEPMKDPKAMQAMVGQTPMGRLAWPGEIAAAILYLASDAASYVTGHDLVIDGGYTLW